MLHKCSGMLLPAFQLARKWGDYWTFSLLSIQLSMNMQACGVQSLRRSTTCVPPSPKEKPWPKLAGIDLVCRQTDQL